LTNIDKNHSRDWLYWMWKPISRGQ